jgi:hypothetical protein
VGKKRHQCGALAKSISVCAASSVRANEVGSLKHELGSEVESVVNIDRRTSINSMPMRPLRPSVRANENSPPNLTNHFISIRLFL